MPTYMISYVNRYGFLIQTQHFGETDVRRHRKELAREGVTGQVRTL